MCRFIKEMGTEGKSEQKVYGVLVDYDLSSWKKDLEDNPSGTLQQRTGTPPYMAHELLLETGTTHLYRHDVESLFYIMLLIGARHTITPAKDGPGTKENFRVVMGEGSRPYQAWFDTQRYSTLGSIKRCFFLDMSAIELSPAVEDFRPWLRDLRSLLSAGFVYKIYHPSKQEEPPLWRQEQAGGSTGGITPSPVPLDDKTLGGYVDYSAIIEPTRYLKGELEGLIIRYETPLPPLPTDAVQTKA